MELEIFELFKEKVEAYLYERIKADISVLRNGDTFVICIEDGRFDTMYELDNFYDWIQNPLFNANRLAEAVFRYYRKWIHAAVDGLYFY